MGGCGNKVDFIKGRRKVKKHRDKEKMELLMRSAVRAQNGLNEGGASQAGTRECGVG